MVITIYMNELLIRCKHNIGCFKYIKIKGENNELIPLRVYLSEVQANAVPSEKDTVRVTIKYKVNTHGKSKWVNEDEIYDSKN